MLPIEQLWNDAAQIEGLIFDLDDTFLDHGKLGSESYGALWKLSNAGLTLLAATGRPSGWGELLARQWPVAAVVSENGAIAHVARGDRVQQLDQRPPALRARARQALDVIVRRLESDFPELERTDDAHLRVSDVTFDVGEHRQLPAQTIREVVGRAEQLGARTTVSSVHLHVTLDQHDKATGCLSVLRSAFGLDTTRARMRFAFIGDSGNDAACFAAFRTSIGVANLSGRPSVPPRFITRGARGAGFLEAARVLLHKPREIGGGHPQSVGPTPAR